MAAVRETKAVEMRYADITAFLPNPHVCPNLRAKFLVHSAGVLGFGELVWHGAPEHDLRRPSTGLDIKHDANIEAATDPFVGFQNTAGVALSQAEVLAGESRDRLSLPPEGVPLRPDGWRMRKPAQHVKLFFKC